MRIVLIQCRCGYWDAIRDRPIAPLGPLAAATLACRDHEVVILDERLTPDLRHDLGRLVDDGKTGLVGFTAYSGPLVKNALALTRFVKSRSHVPVVWGGVHPSLVPAQTVAHPDIDYVVQGEGERTLSRLADSLEAGDADTAAGLPGVWTFRDGKAVCGGPPAMVDLETLPAVPYDLVRVEDYFQSFLGRRYIAYQMSRGCDRGCAFCYNAVYNRGVIRRRPLALAMEDIDRLRARHVFDGVYFLDDNFFAMGKEAIFAFTAEMRRRGLTWYVQGAEIAHLLTYDAAELRRLAAGGLVRVSIGVESGSPRIRKLLNKRESIDEIAAVVERFRETPVRIWTNYITNIPTETLDDLKQSIDLIYRLRRLNPNTRHSGFYRYQPVHGTALARRFRDRITFPSTLEGWGEWSWESMEGRLYAEYDQGDVFHRSLNYAGLFCDAKFDDLYPTSPLRILALMYRPIANFRLKRLNHTLPIDALLIDALTKLF